MRSNHWEYVGFVLLGLGLSLTVSTSIVGVYYEQRPQTNPQYIGYPIPLLASGICITALSILTFHKSRKRKKIEETEGALLPPPPPPLPPPPPPP